jgi:LysM domain
MAKRDITKRPRRALSAQERQELFREFKLGIFALVALVALVVTLCLDRGGSTEPVDKSVKDQTSGKALVRVLWQPPGGARGGRLPVQPDRVQTPKGPTDPTPRDKQRREPKPRERVLPPSPPRPVYSNYVVKRRDTFWKIAQNQLGDGKLWKLIWKANPGIRNPNRLKRGMVIRVPRKRLAGDSARRLAGGPKSPGSSMPLDTSIVIE